MGWFTGVRVGVVFAVAACGGPGSGDGDGSSGEVGETSSAGDGSTSAMPPAGSSDGSSGDSSTSGGVDASSSDDDASDSSSGEPPVIGCGDALVGDDEECDDGNDVDGDGCNADCRVSGQVVWQMTWGDAGEDVGMDIAVDSAGNIVIVGHTELEAYSNQFEIWIGKFDPDGLVIWTKTIANDGHYDEGAGVAVDADDNVIAVGHLDASVSRQVWLGKFDADGNALWAIDDVVEATRARDVAVDASGNVYVLGAASADNALFLRRYDADGTEAWTVTDGAFQPNEIAIGSAGELVVGGSGIRKLDAEGGVEWTMTEGVPGNVQGVAIGATGDIAATAVVAGVGGSDDIWIGRYDADGGEQWTLTRDGAGDFDRGFGVTIDADENVIATGQWVPVLGQINDLWFGKFDRDGAELWMNPIDLPGCAGHAVTTDAAGNVVGTGRRWTDSYDVWLGKLTP